MTADSETRTIDATVTMYTTATCPYCIQAERFLRSKGVSEIAKVRVDLEPARRIEMMVKTGRRTVPQIYVGHTHVGGYEDLIALDRAGELEPLLAAASGAPVGAAVLDASGGSGAVG